jgi:hypothetical protein
MRKVLSVILSLILTISFVQPASSTETFSAVWSDTKAELTYRTFNKSKYWDSVKNRPKSMPQIVVTIDLASYPEGFLVHQVWNGTRWNAEGDFDLAELTALEGKVPVVVRFPEFIACGTSKKFCASELSERIALYDPAGELLAVDEFVVNRFDDPPPFTLSVTGKLSAKLGSYYSATVKLTGKKVARISCEANLMKTSTSLWPPVLETKTFTATINKSLTLRFAILNYSDVPQYVRVECADKVKSVRFAVLKN